MGKNSVKPDRMPNKIIANQFKLPTPKMHIFYSITYSIANFQWIAKKLHFLVPFFAVTIALLVFLNHFMQSAEGII